MIVTVQLLKTNFPAESEISRPVSTVTGLVSGTFSGLVSGTFSGSVSGTFSGSVSGTFSGIVTGLVSCSVTGSVTNNSCVSVAGIEKLLSISLSDFLVPSQASSSPSV